MKKELYALDFFAAETLKNGSERIGTQTVYFLKREASGEYTSWSELTARERAEAELRSQHYYNLAYKGCRVVRLNVMSELSLSRNEIIKKLDELREQIAWLSVEEVTDFARERAYISVVGAIDFLKENDDD